MIARKINECSLGRNIKVLSLAWLSTNYQFRTSFSIFTSYDFYRLYSVRSRKMQMHCKMCIEWNMCYQHGEKYPCGLFWMNILSVLNYLSSILKCNDLKQFHSMNKCYCTSFYYLPEHNMGIHMLMYIRF